MPWRLQVVDGADAGRFFPLPDAGTVVIGNSHKHSDICLHDLQMARVHCQIEVEEDLFTITALSDDKATLVEGQKVARQPFRPGETLRIGNSYLRIEEDLNRDEDDIVEDVEIDEGGGEVIETVEAVEAVEATDATVVDSNSAKTPPKLDWKHLDKLAGHTIGHFELGAVLGRGHSAVTFRARDKEAHREVALKVICPEFPASAEELQQFARTIRKVAAIQEPHLVPWYAAGRNAGYVWIAQEFNEGESLAQVLKRGQSASTMLKWRNALKLAMDLAKALDLLHKRHIIHGNLTPANVLISLDRTAKLNDTLYEEAMRGSKWQEAIFERKLLVELPYRAPERLEEGAYWDATADIYSLGALTYTRLTTVPPFNGKSPGEIIEAIQAGRLVKPKDIVPGCPEAFQNIVLKMLAHNLEDRYETPEKLLDDLESVNTL